MDTIKPVCSDSTNNTIGCLYKKAALKVKQRMSTQPKINYKEDALEAVKLDPAVLEAQVTLTAKENNVKSPVQSKKDKAEIKEQDLGGASPYVSSGNRFDRSVALQQAALMSLSPEQYEFILMYVDALRKERQTSNKTLECAFCKNNGEPVSWYTGHGLKDIRGRVLCPVLRGFRCPRCGATGARAHTIKYCPENIILK